MRKLNYKYCRCLVTGKEQSLVLEVGVRPVREGEEGGVRVAKGKDTQDSLAKLYRCTL